MWKDEGSNERRMSNVDKNRGKWRNPEVVRKPSNGRNDYRGNYENGRQENQWLKSKNRFQKDDRRFNDRGYQFRNGSQKDDFKENHDNWDRFLHEFSFALRTAVNETTVKTPAELFLGRKIITPFCKLELSMEGAEYV
ncbi:uncharacterized protein TNCV_603931 [Trichonephila clavipes]|nr:uncharacterized protein TNCV_603931 [Trichonephila clavipes]